MKKIIIIICTIFIVIIGFLSYLYFNKPKYITSDEAKEIAINDVSNKDNNYTFNSIEYSETNNIYVYTLEFSDNYNLYTYKINAKTKKIIFSKKESINNNKIYLKDNEVLDIVLKHAKFKKTDCNIISNVVMLEEGIPYYKIIFYNSNVRYEYKVNAYTGAIISVVKLNENAG